jgi:hypothetical protein
MNPQVDLEGVVTDWLRNEASASGSDRVLAAALGRVSTVRQERRRPTWLRTQVGLAGRLAMVAATAAAVVIAIVSLDVLYGRLGIHGGDAAAPTSIPASTMTQCPRASAPQPPGPQLVTVFAPIRLTIALPESWLGGCYETTTAGRAQPVWWASHASAPGGIGITSADPVPAGCEGFPGWDRAEVTISGYAGERFDYVGPFEPPFTDCHPNVVMDQLGDTSGRGPETLFTLWMLDVNGERLSLLAGIKELDYQQQDELRQLVESVHIDTVRSSQPPSPAATPAEAVYPPPGFDIPPLDRQSMTVDGIPFSFSVPTEGWSPGIQLKESYGSFKNRSLYIAKNTAGGQRAEAVVFWTTWPGGTSTGPCHTLLSQPVGSSAADLANLMVTVAGIDVVSGPSEVTLGGLAAKHLVVTVRERLGCDPGYFFTWPDECWGSCWISTAVGDWIGVWIIAVDGKRVVIEAETTRQGVYVLDQDGTRRFVEETTEYTDEELRQEVQHIVESIRFE